MDGLVKDGKVYLPNGKVLPDTTHIRSYFRNIHRFWLRYHSQWAADIITSATGLEADWKETDYEGNLETI